MKSSGLIAAVMLTCGCEFAMAYDVPGWSNDSRVRQVLYRCDEVVRIDAQRGFATHIALDPREHILVVARAIGMAGRLSRTGASTTSI